MRKITKESSEAFVNFKSYKKDNTEVSVRFDSVSKECIPSKYMVSSFYLHGNLIARIRDGVNPSVKIDLCGWHTPTTRERINGILDALGYDFGIAQRNHEQVLVRNNGQDILKLSTDSFDPEFAKKVFNSSEFIKGTDLNAIADF